MSKETYVLKVGIDTSQIKELESRLSGIMGIKSSGSSGGDNNTVIKNIAKLGVIATGVGGLLGLVKKISEMTISASPMLQSMLKLFDNSITLILRPIGDFIGFTLRPIMLFFLQYVALPFYRYFTPFMQKYGTIFGQWIMNPVVGAPLVVGAIAAVGLAVKAGSDYISSQIAKLIPSASATSTVPKTTPETTATGKTAPESGMTPDQRISLGNRLRNLGLLPKSGTTGGSTGTGAPIKTTGGTTVTIGDTMASIISRLKTGDITLARTLAKLAPVVLRTMIKNIPEISGIIALATGDASWLIPGWAGEAGGTSLSQTLNQPIPTITSRFTNNSRLNKLPAGFTQGSNPNSMGNPTFTINVNAGTIVDPKALTDAIQRQLENKVPDIVQNSLRRTIIH